MEHNSASMNAVATKRVYSSMALPSEAIEIFKDQNIVVATSNEPSYKLDREKFLSSIKGCHGIMITPLQRIDNEALDAAGENLKVVSACSVGVEHIDLRACEQRNILVKPIPGINTNAVCEFTIGLLLNVSRKITEAISRAKDMKEWPYNNIDYLSGMGLANKTVGIFGLGQIGLAIAKRLASFEVKSIIYNKRSGVCSEAQKLGFELASFERILQESDFLIVTCSLNDATRNLFNKSAFDKMKSNAVFINITRGLVVNQDDLYEALKAKRIFGAGLDVTYPEPLPLDHKLYTLENCYITPHIAYRERATQVKMIMLAIQNMVENL